MTQELLQRERTAEEQAVTVTFQQRQASRLRSALALSVLTGAGVAGRAAFQTVPSVEPLLPLAILVGVYGGARRGIVVGAAGFVASNFVVWGGQGPWTAFQVSGAALAALIGAGIGRISERPVARAGALVGGVLAYEAVINLGSLVWLVGGLAAAVPYLAAAIPFAVIHLLGTLAFGGIIHGGRHWLTRLFGEDRLEACDGGSGASSRDSHLPAVPVDSGVPLGGTDDSGHGGAGRGR